MFAPQFAESIAKNTCKNRIENPKLNWLNTIAMWFYSKDSFEMLPNRYRFYTCLLKINIVSHFNEINDMSNAVWAYTTKSRKMFKIWHFIRLIRSYEILFLYSLNYRFQVASYFCRLSCHITLPEAKFNLNVDVPQYKCVCQTVCCTGWIKKIWYIHKVFLSILDQNRTSKKLYHL